MPFFASLRSRALIVILLATLPLLAGVAEGYRQEREAAIAAIADEIGTHLRFLIRQDGEVARDIELLLRIMANADEMANPTATACSGLARRLMSLQPDYANMGAVWPDGRLFCSALEITQRVNVAEQGWFQEVRDGRHFSSGHYQDGLLTGVPGVTYGYSQGDAVGVLRAALFVSVKLDWFGRLLRSVQLPEDWHALIVSRDGRIAARYPDALPIPVSNREEIANLLGDPPFGPVVRGWHRESLEHLHGIAPLPSTRGALFLIVGADMRQALAPIEMQFHTRTALAVLFALASILFAWFAIRGSVLDWTERMNAAVRRFGDGDLASRAGQLSEVSELQALTDRFDAMAEQIETFNRDLENLVAERTAALKRSNAELEAFAYSVSHDLRAPLRAIGGFADILAEHHRSCLGAEGDHCLDHIRSAADQMNRLIDDLLQYSRVGRGVLRSEAVDLSPLLQDIASLFEARLARGGRIEIAAPLAAPRGDPRLIRQALINLIDNAIKYQPAGQPPVVRIGTETQSGRVLIHVADNGIGIAPEHREVVFNVFQRLHADDEYPGTGIGLAIVMKAARLMGGTVTLDSEPGRGSVFTLRLPAAGPASE